jgi:hypothetical protein
MIALAALTHSRAPVAHAAESSARAAVASAMTRRNPSAPNDFAVEPGGRRWRRSIERPRRRPRGRGPPAPASGRGPGRPRPHQRPRRRRLTSGAFPLVEPRRHCYGLPAQNGKVDSPDGGHRMVAREQRRPRLDGDPRTPRAPAGGTACARARRRSWTDGGTKLLVNPLALRDPETEAVRNAHAAAVAIAASSRRPTGRASPGRPRPAPPSRQCAPMLGASHDGYRRSSRR